PPSFWTRPSHVPVCVVDDGWEAGAGAGAAAWAGSAASPPTTSAARAADTAKRTFFTTEPFDVPAPIPFGRRCPQLSPVGGAGGGKSTAPFVAFFAVPSRGVRAERPDEGVDQAVD